MNKFDKNFKGNIILPDKSKIVELFNKISNLDTYDLLQYSIINQIDLNKILYSKVNEMNEKKLIHIFYEKSG
jgi:hypothetical protein